MKKIVFKLMFSLLSLFALTFMACDPEEHDHNEQEVISRVTLTVKDANGKETAYMWNDPDGENGSQKPTIDTIKLQANGEYSASIKLENATVNPAENITTEVQNESTAHVFIYTYDQSNAVFEITDKDSEGKPLGITTKVTSKTVGNGKLRIQLRHEPTDKNNAQNPGGETDVDVTFEVIVK